MVCACFELAVSCVEGDGLKLVRVGEQELLSSVELRLSYHSYYNI